ncbi:TPA: Exc2 family lipoprotein [Salmonella enterica]
MKHPSATLLCAVLTIALMTTACVPQTSAERHARQYVYAADDGFDPNFRVKKADSIQMMVPFFRQFQNMGIKDRASGVSVEDAQQRINAFRSEAFLKSIQGKTTFAGRQVAMLTAAHHP